MYSLCILFSGREATIGDSSLFQERTCLRLGVYEAVSEQKVVFPTKAVLVEAANLVCDVLIESLRRSRVDGDGYKAINGDETTLLAIGVLVVEGIGSYGCAYLVESIVLSISEGSCGLDLMSLHLLLAVLASFTRHKLAYRYTHRKLQVHVLPQATQSVLLLTVQSHALSLEGCPWSEFFLLVPHQV